MTIKFDEDEDELFDAIIKQFENARIKVTPDLEEDIQEAIEDAIDQLEIDPTGCLAELLFDAIMNSLEPDDNDMWSPAEE